MLRYYEYRRVLAAAEHASALECFELAAKREPESAEAWAGVSLLFTDAWAHGFAGQAGSAAALERARETARRAMDIDGENLHANLALSCRAVFQRRRFSRGGRAHACGVAGKRRGAGLSSALCSCWRETTPAAVRSSRPPSNGRRKYRAATTRHAPSWRFASNVMTTLSLRRCGSTRPSGRWGTSSSRPRAALGGRPDLAARAHARFVELEPDCEVDSPI